MNENKKLYLSVTETSDPCPRKFELEMKYKTGQLKYKPNPVSHYYGARGTLVHYTLEQIFNNNPVEWNYEWFAEEEGLSERIPEWLFDECLDFVKLTYDKAIVCIQENPELFYQVIVEERLRYPLDDEFVLTGKPDLVTDKSIIDWKSSKYTKANSRKYFKQCFGYDYLLTKTYKAKYRDYILIFLGGDIPKVVVANEEDRTLANKQFKEDLITSRILKKQASINKHLPAKFSFICGMCKWNGHCRGV